jgi:hypothetical protein
VPLWGYADAVHSNADGIEVGQRFYGYYPTSSHLVVVPDRVSDKGFRDASEHRASLPSAYNFYTRTDTDASYAVAQEDLHILYRPLFITSLMLDDFLADNDYFGATRILVSSSSSKTAYATAFCLQLRDKKPQVIGLTSPGNVEFTSSLGCYDDVVAYDDLTTIPVDAPALYADFAGSASLRDEIHLHFGDQLVYDAMIGVAHGQAFTSISVASGPEPTLFFAPTQMKKRGEDWGPGGIEKLYREVWAEFVPKVQGWIDVTHSEGPKGLESAWLEVLAGQTAPRNGHVINL